MIPFMPSFFVLGPNLFWTDVTQHNLHAGCQDNFSQDFSRAQQQLNNNILPTIHPTFTQLQLSVVVQVLSEQASLSTNLNAECQGKFTQDFNLDPPTQQHPIFTRLQPSALVQVFFWSGVAQLQSTNPQVERQDKSRQDLAMPQQLNNWTTTSFHLSIQPSLDLTFCLGPSLHLNRRHSATIYKSTSWVSGQIQTRLGHDTSTQQFPFNYPTFIQLQPLVFVKPSLKGIT